MVKNPLHPPSTDSSSELNNNNTTSSTSFDTVVSSVYTPCYDTASSIFAPGGPSSNLILGGQAVDRDVEMLYNEDLSGVEVSDLESEMLLEYEGEDSSVVTLPEDSSVVILPVNFSVVSLSVGKDVRVIRPSLASPSRLHPVPRSDPLTSPRAKNLRVK